MTVLFCGEYQKRIDFVQQVDEKRAPFTPFIVIMGDKWDPLFEGMSVVPKERNGCFLELWSSGDVIHTPAIPGMPFRKESVQCPGGP